MQIRSLKTVNNEEDNIYLNATCGQSYKHLCSYITTLESYWLENCLYYDSRVVTYEPKMFYRSKHCPKVVNSFLMPQRRAKGLWVSTYIHFLLQGSPDHPCLSGNGDCRHICIPLGANKRKCGCSVGYTVGDTEIECRQHNSFAVVSQLKTARGFDLSNGGDAMVPIAGKGKIE